MLVDIYTSDEAIVEKIVKTIDRAYCVDVGRRPDLYQFWDLTPQEALCALREKNINLNKIEVRRVKDGRVLWPRRDNFHIIEILDLMSF